MSSRLRLLGLSAWLGVACSTFTSTSSEPPPDASTGTAGPDGGPDAAPPRSGVRCGADRCQTACCVARSGSSWGINCKPSPSDCEQEAYGVLACDDDSVCGANVCCAREDGSGHFSSSCVAPLNCTPPAIHLCDPTRIGSCPLRQACAISDGAEAPPNLSLCK